MNPGRKKTKFLEILLVISALIMGVLIVMLVYRGRQKGLIEAGELEERTLAGAYPMPSEIIESDRNVYFAYTEIPDMIFEKMNQVSYVEGAPVAREDLRYLSILYWGMDKTAHKGELIVHKDIADKVSLAFFKLYRASYTIESVRLVDEFGGNDEVSMAKNNTSAFNARQVVGGNGWSMHAYGLAIDINPFYNPYVDEEGNVLPLGAEQYADREQAFVMKITTSDYAYQVFTSLGFSWGGDWTGVKDYQHFEYVLEDMN